MKTYNLGQVVMVYDRYRFAIPLKAQVVEFSKENDGVAVKLLESNNAHYPVHETVWVHSSQLGPVVIPDLMKFDEYLRLSEVTEKKFPDGLHLDSEQAETLHHVMGVVTEAGELMDQMKRHLIYGKHLDLINLIEELGDLSWYMAGIMRLINMHREWHPHDPEIQSEVFTKNINKLRQRFKEKFDSHLALNRDLEAERKILEDTGNTLLRNGADDDFVRPEELKSVQQQLDERDGPSVDVDLTR